MSAPKVQHKARGAVSAPSDRTIYSLPKRTSDNIVDLVLKIMDGEGPRPMKNLRPTQKTRTGADQFDVDHHGEYEARGQPSRDKVGRVHTHNSAFPKMYDELNKRKSTAQPAAYSANQNVAAPPANFDPNCRICVKLKKRSELDGRRRRIRKRSRPYQSYRAKSNRDTKTKITKPKKTQRRYRSPSKAFKLSRIRTNKGCQCTSYYLPTETKSVSTFNDNFLSVTPQEKAPPAAPSNLGSNDNYDLKSVKSPVKKPSKKSDIDSGNPETNSAPSVSSYNSFMSMEHEPMIE